MVLVCHKHPFIFLKTRKTAGKSVEMALETLCVPPGQAITEPRPYQNSEYGIIGRRGDRYKLKGWRRPLRLWEWRNHQSAAFVYRKIGQEEWDKRRKITSIRNPFDRMVSYYHFITRKDPNAPTEFSQIRSAFAEFCKSRRWRDDRRVVHLNGKFIIDHAVRLEHMADDLKQIASALELPLDPSAIPVTKSMAKSRKAYDVPDYYDQDVIDVIKSRMAWVFDHYDYPTEPQPKFAPAEVAS